MLTQKWDTHVKQLTGPYIGAAMATVHVTPKLTIEPQVALFRRTADSYAFLREELEKLIGRDVLEAERLYSRDGAQDETILGALIGMERRFRGLAALAASEIGAACALVGVAEPEALRLAAEARAELAGWPSAEDLSHDPRVMVPIGYDVERREVRCWAVVGLSSRDLVTHYEKPPAIVSPRSGVQMVLDRGVARVPYEVWIECSLKEPLDREELRALCDRCGTLTEIKTALGAVS